MSRALTALTKQTLRRLRVAPRYYSSAAVSSSSFWVTTTNRRALSSEVAVSDENKPTAIAVSKEDQQKEETKRKRLSDVLISEVLKTKHAYRWIHPVISRSATVQEAIETAIEGGLSAMMVLEHQDERRVVGLLTSRDLLRILASGFKEGKSHQEILNNSLVGEHMLPISQVIYARPEETVGMCRTLMAKLGVKALPILSRGGVVEGLITARDMSDYGLSAKDKGGKKSYLDDISERVGLSSNTSMAEPPAYMKAHLALEHDPLYTNVGVAVLPHPFKMANGIGRDLNDMMGPRDNEDPDLSEDAHFIATVRLPDEKEKTMRNFTYMGIADGVGSWREYGVDPRQFSRSLMNECENVLLEASRNGLSDNQTYRHIVSPSEVLEQAFARVKAENVIGSSTACIAMFDGIRHQLHFSNLGDCGIMVLRHIDSDVAGTLKRDRTKTRMERNSDLRVNFVSQQQLQSFNHPYQLGWTGDEIPAGEKSSFRTARDSCTTSIHVRRGDIIIMATDGLYDNVDEDEICSLALEWEQKHGFIRGGDIAARERRWSMGNSLTKLSLDFIEEFAQNLCYRARENSLDTTTDSPFAILAKENDIMWSGGMPDDCTVLAIHVVGRDPADVMDATQM